VAITVVAAMALFGLWFLFDPDPQACGANSSSAERRQVRPARQLFTEFNLGGSSVWSLVIAIRKMNAGMLALPVAAVFLIAFRRRVLLIDAEKCCGIWMAALFIVFSCQPALGTLLLEAMPGCGAVRAHWHRISRKVFVISLIVMAQCWFLCFPVDASAAGNDGGGVYGRLY